jgi:hypothetical protein
MAERFDERPCIRFELDGRAERGATVLRVCAALVTMLAGAWLLLLPYSVPRFFAVAGLGFSALWLIRAQRARRKAKLPSEAEPQDYLELRPDALCMRQSGAEQVIPWGEVVSVAIDEDRLLVVVERKNASAIMLEPQYRGIALRPLAEAMHDALVRSRISELSRQAAHG